ncbi:hypothetical protein CD798_14200 [Bacillaceae bacterium SAOS 7]|nr:hypothetical protein CD798_14200 [Bacillaceae bacterium SAOS 7]
MEGKKVKHIGTKKLITNFLNIGLGMIAIGYVLVLIKIVLLKYGFTSGERSINLVPFEFLKLFNGGTELDIALKNVLGNTAIFIPLGIFVSYILKKRVW